MSTRRVFITVLGGAVACLGNGMRLMGTQLLSPLGWSKYTSIFPVAQRPHQRHRRIVTALQ
jgi:hypothetical protein